jgi:hypothetical protein
VTRFSILDFLIGFPNFFKPSPKMLYLGPDYPKNWGHIPVENFQFFYTPLWHKVEVGPSKYDFIIKKMTIYLHPKIHKKFGKNFNLQSKKFSLNSNNN